MDDKTRAGLLGDIEYFSAKLERDNTSMLFLPLAKAYVELTRFDEAADILMQSLDVNPDIASAKTLLARCYVGMGRIEEAKGLLTEVRVIDPNNYMAEKLLGKIYQSESEYKKAIVSYKNAYFSAPEDYELRELIEELLAETGMQFSDLRDERNLMEDEELLDTIGQELAEEVKSEIGETVERPNLSDEEVKSTVEDIIGHSIDVDEDNLNKFAEDYSPPEVTGEIEEEMLAEVDDEVKPTESHKEVLEAVRKQEQNYFADLEDSGKKEPLPAGRIDDLAAELSVDFGLENIKSEAEVFADDEYSRYYDNSQENEPFEHDGEERLASTCETVVPLQSILEDMDNFEEINEIEEEHLASIDDMFDFVAVSEDDAELGAFFAGSEPQAETASEETAAEETLAAEEEVPAGEDVQAEDADEIYDEIITDEKIEDALKEVLSKDSDEPVNEAEAGVLAENSADADTADKAEPETADEIIFNKESEHPVIDVQEAESESDTESDVGEISADIIENGEELVTEIRQEIHEDVMLDDELATLFALDEMAERERVDVSDEHVNTDADESDAERVQYKRETLDVATYEQVNKLENLLELIKNNIK